MKIYNQIQRLRMGEQKKLESDFAAEIIRRAKHIASLVWKTQPCE